MRIQTETGADFKLIQDPVVEITAYNAMISDIGEQSNPITLPGIPENLKLLNWSGRLDQLYKPVSDIKVLVTAGVVSRWCNMGIHDPDEDGNISCTLYFGSADFYSRVGERKLKALPWPNIYSPTYSNQTLAQRVQYLINILKSEYNNPTLGSAFGIRPVATSQEYTWIFKKKNDQGILVDEKVTGLFILNGFEKWQNPIDFAQTGTIDLVAFEGEYEQQIVQNSAICPFTTGYGMTPLLKLKYVLEMIFTSYGYTLDMSGLWTYSGYVEDILCTEQYYNNILLVNNIADAIYSGYLRYSQLVPDVTVKAFLSETAKNFSGKFIIDEVSKKVTFLRFSQSIMPRRSIPDLDLTKYCQVAPKLGLPEFKKIKCVDSNLPTETESSETEVETIDFSFLQKVSIEDKYRGEYLPIYGQCTLTLEMPTVDGIVHLNSLLKIDGKEIKETSSQWTEIRFIKANSGSAAASTNFNYTPYTVYYKTSVPLFSDIAPIPINYIAQAYSSYSEFREHSNIPCRIKMNIPDNVLSRLNYYTPKLVHGEIFLIESLKYVLESESSQQIVLRTVRHFL